MPRSLGITTLKIMAAIREGGAYGLEIVARTGLASGTVYPALGRLKEAGLVLGRWEDQRIAEREGRPRRRYYELTPVGLTRLTEGTARIVEAAATLDPSVLGDAV